VSEAEEPSVVPAALAAVSITSASSVPAGG